MLPQVWDWAEGPVREREDREESVQLGIIRRVIQVAITMGILATILFLSAGRWNWMWGWVLIGLYLVGIGMSGVFMMQISPQTIAERSKTEGMRDWDKWVGGAFGVVYFLLIPLIAGLDIRFEWMDTFPLWLHLAGAAGFGLGLALFSWSMVTNAHFSTVVRPKEEDVVCKRGPYQIVRHPGYVGGIVQSLSVPLVLGSIWALVPGATAALLLVVRTAFEDRTLQRELVGYEDYAREVGYRLLPGVW